MSNYTFYCISNVVCDKVYTKLRNLKSIPNFTLDVRNLTGGEIHTSLATVSCAGVVVTKYCIRRHRHHTVIGVKTICTHNDVMSDDSYAWLSDLNNYIKLNRLGNTYVLDWSSYLRATHLLELEDFFLEDSEVYRYDILLEGHITLDIGDVKTPLFLASKMSFKTHVVVLFDVPADIEKELEVYNIDLAVLRGEFEMAENNK